jgi:ketosteroid isomerase-like protein
VFVADESDPVQLVLSYLEIVQSARARRDSHDWEAVRGCLAPDVVIKVASPWSAEPWRTVLAGADAVVQRLQAPINSATSLTTQNINVQRAGDDVLVEQLSTLTDEAGKHTSMVCHLFSVADGRITGIRTYRNDQGLPAG